MTAPTLWIEMTIAGSVYLASLFFLLMGICGVKDLECVAHWVDPYKTYIAVAVVALSYIFGFVAHRIIQITKLTAEWIGQRITKFIARKIAKWEARKQKEPTEWPEWRQDLVATRLKTWNSIAGRYDRIKECLKSEYLNFLSSDLEKRMDQETKIWALTPQRIHHEVDFQFAQVALLRSLLFSSPMLALSSGYWLLQADRDHHLLAVGLCFLGFYVCLIPSFLRQYRQYEVIRKKVLLLLAEKPAGSLVASSSQTSGPAAPLVTIKGIDFGKAKENCTVTVNGMAVTPTAWEPTRIVVPVPKVQIPAGEKALDVVVTIKVVLPDAETGTDHTLTLQLTPAL